MIISIHVSGKVVDLPVNPITIQTSPLGDAGSRQAGEVNVTHFSRHGSTEELVSKVSGRSELPGAGAEQHCNADSISKL